MTGFIIGGTILGNCLCSLIRKCILPGPRKRRDAALCTLYQLSSKAKKQEKWGPADLQAGSEKHWTVKPHRALSCSCPLSSVVKKKHKRGKGMHKDFVRQQKKMKGEKEAYMMKLISSGYQLREKVVFQWFHLQSNNILPVILQAYHPNLLTFSWITFLVQWNLCLLKV